MTLGTGGILALGVLMGAALLSRSRTVEAAGSRDTGPIYTGAVDPPKADAVDTIGVNFRRAGQEGIASVGIPVGIQRGWTGAEKADCIAATINGGKNVNPGKGGPWPFRATSLGDTVSIVGQDGASILRVIMIENSKQPTVTWTCSSNGEPADTPPPGHPGPRPPLVGRVEFAGALAGLDPDGEPAQFTFGTARYSTSYSIGPGTVLETLLDQAASDLRFRGINATAGPAFVSIELGRGDGRQVIFGCTDVGLETTMGLGEKEDD